MLLVLLTACGSTSGGGDGGVNSPTDSWDDQADDIGLDPATISGVVSAEALVKTQMTMAIPNAPDHPTLPGYIATDKSLCCESTSTVPFRVYTAACDTDTDEPRMFVSMTLAVEDENSEHYNPASPRIGSVFETKLNKDTGALEPTGNQAILPICNESNGIAVSPDCSRVGVLCATEYEAPFSTTYEGDFHDLTPTATMEGSVRSREGGPVDTSQIVQPNNEGWPDRNQFLYNGELWLLEWDVASGTPNLTEEPEQFVIHRAVGGQPFSSRDLVYNPDDETYGAAFATATFDSSGKRHRSAALMVVARGETSDDWLLNPNDRGFGWECGFGHVWQARVFWNPFHENDHTGTTGSYGAICTTDNNRDSTQGGGNIAIKYEDQSLTARGYTHYIVPSSAAGLSGGAGHTMVPVDEDITLGIATAVDLQPEGWDWYDNTLAMFEAAPYSVENGYEGLWACNYYDDATFCSQNMSSVYSLDENASYPIFYRDSQPHINKDGEEQWTTDWVGSGQIDKNDLNQIGIFRTDSKTGRGGYEYLWEDGGKMKWVAKDDDCMLSSPQLVDLQNGRYLVGYAKFQCISDGFGHQRMHLQGKSLRTQAMRVPKEYYLMEIDKDGNVLVDPFVVEAGWGELNRIVSIGPGKAAWTYLQSPTIADDGTYADPSNHDWELVVYTSPYPG
ncbi:MAG: hypothetical protein AAGF92_09830 [Myxococcota bacterium]